MCCLLLPLVALLRRTELERVSKYFKLEKVYETDALGEKWPWAAFRLQNVLGSATQPNSCTGANGWQKRGCGSARRSFVVCFVCRFSWNRKPVSKTIPTPY
jgi:hypothetical protein